MLCFFLNLIFLVEVWNGNNILLIVSIVLTGFMWILATWRCVPRFVGNYCGCPVDREREIIELAGIVGLNVVTDDSVEVPDDTESVNGEESYSNANYPTHDVASGIEFCSDDGTEV